MCKESNVVEARKAAVLTINEEDTRHCRSAKHGGVSEKTRHVMEPSIRKPVLNWKAKDEHTKTQLLKGGNEHSSN